MLLARWRQLLVGRVSARSVAARRAIAPIAGVIVMVLIGAIAAAATDPGRGALAASGWSAGSPTYSSGTSSAALTAASAASSAAQATQQLTTLLDPTSLLGAPPVRRLADPTYSGNPNSTPYAVTIGGSTRNIRIHLPYGVAPAKPRPLIIVLPGWRRTARDAEVQYGFDIVGNRADATVLYVDGVHNSWNAGTCCGYAASRKLDDVQALHILVDAVGQMVKIDRRHVTLAGFSNGAMLAYRMACSQSSQIAGAIIGSGSLQVPASSCTPQPISLVVSHGALDGTLPIDGVKYSAYLGSPVASEAASQAPFEAADACKTTSASTAGGFDITHARGCAHGVTLDTYVDQALGHDWPGVLPDGVPFAQEAWALLGGRPSTARFAP